MILPNGGYYLFERVMSPFRRGDITLNNDDSDLWYYPFESVMTPIPIQNKCVISHIRMGDMTYSTGDITYSNESVISAIQVCDITDSKGWSHLFELIVPPFKSVISFIRIGEITDSKGDITYWIDDIILSNKWMDDITSLESNRWYHKTGINSKRPPNSTGDTCQYLEC